jgi:ribosomal protein L2
MNKKINYNIFKYINNKFKIGTHIKSGHNFTGKICVHHKCSGFKKKYCYIDFYRRINCFGIIFKVIKDFNRTAFIGSIIYENGLYSYIILSEHVKKGDRIYSGVTKNFKSEDILNGYASSLYNINLFSIVNNIELYPYFGSVLSRSAGVGSLLISRKNKKVIIKLKSG